MKKSTINRCHLIGVMTNKIEWADNPVELALEFLDMGYQIDLTDKEAQKFVDAAFIGALYKLDPTNAGRLHQTLIEVQTENEVEKAPLKRGPKTTFNVILKEVGPNKIGVIKEVRAAVPGIGLAEAKALVESAPKSVREVATKEEAEDIKKSLEAAGATVEVQ